MTYRGSRPDPPPYSATDADRRADFIEATYKPRHGSPYHLDVITLRVYADLQRAADKAGRAGS